MNEKRKDTPRLTDEEEEEIMRRGREALQRINDAKSPELKSAENAYAEAYRKVKSAVLEMLQCHMVMVRHTFLDDAHPKKKQMMRHLAAMRIMRAMNCSKRSHIRAMTCQKARGGFCLTYLTFSQALIACRLRKNLSP